MQPTPAAAPAAAPEPARFLRASPNEAQRLLEQQRQARRLDRIRQVRDQERQLAAERRQRFRSESGNQWSQVIERLEDEWCDAKQQECRQLEVLLDRLSLEMGRAQRAAVEANADKRMQVEELREALAAAQDSEIQRCAIAAQDQRREHYNRIGPALIRRALLHSVHTQESMRAKLIAGQCRERLGSSVPTVEVAPQPLARVNRLTARRSGLRYDKTSIHREYVVVRCDQPARDDASPAKTVRHAAAVESRRRAEEIRARQTTLEALAKNATTRHEKAIESIQMDKKRNKMIKELDQLDLDDRRRKQVNAGLYANRFRPDYIRMGPNELNSRFVQQFGVGKLFWLQ